MTDDPPTTMTTGDVYAALAAAAHDQWLSTGRIREICRAAYPQHPITWSRFRALLVILTNKGCITRCSVQEAPRLHTRYWSCPPPGVDPPPPPPQQEPPQWYQDIMARKDEILARLAARRWRDMAPP